MFALAAIAWVGFEAPPGGRWVVVHLFTLGVVTPLIVAFSQHQAETILRVPGRSRVWLRTLLTTGALLLLLGMVTDVRASVAVLALVLTALPGVWATSARIAAGVALAVTAFGAVNVVVPLLRTVKRKGPGAPAPGVLLAAATTWLALGIGMDAVVVLAGAWAWLEVIGSIVLIGALAQAIVATLLDVTTSWLPRERRLTLRPRLDAAPRWVLAAPQAAVLAVAVASID